MIKALAVLFTREYPKTLLDIASAGLRCGRYVIVNRPKLKKDKLKQAQDLGYHMGKFYAYMWVLSQFGLCFIVEKKKIYGYTEYVELVHKGKIDVYKGAFTVGVFMDKRFFYQVMNHNDPHLDKRTVQGITKRCKEI